MMESKDKSDILEEQESFDITKYPITTNAFTWTPMCIFLYCIIPFKYMSGILSVHNIACNERHIDIRKIIIDIGNRSLIIFSFRINARLHIRMCPDSEIILRI